MILLYHKVSRQRKTIWYVTELTFRRQMELLRKSGRIVVPLKDYDPHNKKHVAITFDGGYDEMYDVAVPILKEFGYEYDIFVIGNYIGKDNSFDVVEPLENFLMIPHLKEMVQTGGAHLQWHTNTHKRVDAFTDRQEWISELTIPDWIRDLDPTGFIFFAYPYGGNAQWQYDEVEKRFRGALFVDGGSDFDLYRLNREMIFETTDMRMLLASRIGRLTLRIVRSIKDGSLPKKLLRKIKGFFK